MCVFVYISFPPHFQVAKAVPHLSALENDPSQQLVSAICLLQNPLGTPEHIATFVVNTFFGAIVGATFGKDFSTTTMSEKMTVWFKAYQ